MVMMNIFSVLVVIATIYCLAKRYETRLVLLVAGFLLCIIGGAPLDGFKAFSAAMKQTKLFESIIAVMGFALVLKYTECDKHLINLLVKPLRKAGSLLIPATVLVTFFINISITSSAGASAAIGAILIPLMLAAGIHPAIAGAAIYAGTYGAMFNPGYPQNAIIESVSSTDTVTIVANHFYPLLLCGVIGAISLWIYARIAGEDKGYILPDDMNEVDDSFKVNLLYAFVPLVPIIILVLGGMNIVPLFKPFTISHAMIIGCVLAVACTRKSVQQVSKEFWKGAGEAFGHVFGIIICALIFVEGLETVGLIDELVQLMISNPSIAKISSGVGPFILGILSGSGDAAAVAFNTAVTIHADSFGIDRSSMGSVVAISGALGRSMSPVAGGMIICATLAGTTSMETAKRNAPGMIIATASLIFTMLYM